MLAGRLVMQMTRPPQARRLIPHDPAIDDALRKVNES
jgi:hypothetical protein